MSKLNYEKAMDRMNLGSDRNRKNVEQVIKNLQNVELSELEELKKMIEQLQEEKRRLLGNNARGAGRKARFSESQIAEILAARKEGATIAQLSARFDCSIGLIHKIIHRAEKA